ncbi:MAG: pyridoxal kinase [Coriobacteriales bacterium]|nr:pyridoxal kinase [Coriobacteriales bacterium]
MIDSSYPVLYTRPEHYIPRIAAVHDMCGYGKCSLGVAIPVLSAAGCDVCPVPTALFSAHTRYPVFTMHDTTEILDGYLDAWKQIGVGLDGIYSGFLGSAEQVALIERLYAEYPNALHIVDPVMGDAGKRYPTYTEELCAAMGSLVNGADILTPNLTEASILTGYAYEGQDVSYDYVEKIINALLSQGAKTVILKGIDHNDGKLRNYVACGTEIVAELAHRKLPYMLHGTGDLFCSALTAAVYAGRDVVEATRFAGEFVREAMTITQYQPDYQQRGVSFESCLGSVAALLVVK